MKEQTLNVQDARLAALYEVSSRLGKSLYLEEVLNQVMDSIIQLTDAERGFVMLYDEDTGELGTAAARNVDQETIDGDAMEISRTVIERAVASGRGILTSNAQEEEWLSKETSVVSFRLLSIMCAPLQARGQILGAVYVDNRFFTNVFDEADLELLVTFANQAAIAIENARLFTQTDQALARRVEELSLFQRIDQQLNKSLDLNRVLSLALNWAIALTNADGGSIGLLEGPEDDPEMQQLRLLIYRGAEESSELRVVACSHPVLAQVLARDSSILTRDVTMEESIDGTPALVQLAVPIKRDGVITGLITLETQHASEISREDVAFVERLADRAAVAIKNARLYEAVQAANQAKSDFVSLVTHELRLPMTSIKGYADLLSSGMAGSLSDQQKQFLEVIRRNLDRMGTLISDLADINRIESGRMQFENKDFDIRDVVEDVLASFQEATEAKEQTIAIEIEDDLPPVHADPTRIAQVLSNLISNAHKYTPAGGVITIRAVGNHEFAQVAVSDTGIGISEENQASLFTQFFRAEDRAVREQPGWGLGLSIVRKIVEAQNGAITFASELNSGSTFTFTVPLATIGA